MNFKRNAVRLQHASRDQSGNKSVPQVVHLRSHDVHLPRDDCAFGEVEGIELSKQGDCGIAATVAWRAHPTYYYVVRYIV